MADNNLLGRLDGLVSRFEEVGTLITDPAVIADMKRFVKLNKEYRDLEKIVTTRNEYVNTLNGINEARQMLDTEPVSYTHLEDSTALGATHILHNKPVAFHKSAKLSLRLQTDTLDNKLQYGIVRLQNGRRSWTGGVYRNGWVDADIKETGSYTLGQEMCIRDSH